MIIANIGTLLTLETEPLHNAFLEVDQGVVIRFGSMASAPRADVDAERRVVMPGFVDCHTHLANMGQMHGSFEDRCRAVAAAQPEELRASIERQIAMMLAFGTTTVEIKTCYGSPEKCLDAMPHDVIRTEMAPPDWTLWRQPHFVDALAEGMTAERLLATKTPVKVHVLDRGLEMALEAGAVSVEHLLHATKRDVATLAQTSTLAVLLPAMAYYTRAGRFAPARQLIDAGVKVALGTDSNPGDSPSFSMQMVMHLACREMGMTCEEAIRAATLHAAAALRLDHRLGSLAPGKDANFLILETGDYRDLPAVIGSNLVRKVYRRTYAAGELSPA
ncbi:amidohydrolase family protein [Bryobacter aggregatus]|uniref:amidohydrolase family protein n=1 Tax=Bryobacter aggregatus TaxID=360054 RepID=UPI0004E1CE1E|nr:amidohydrolase family protein [Bryobacter aggregatus]